MQNWAEVWGDVWPTCMSALSVLAASTGVKQS